MSVALVNPRPHVFEPSNVLPLGLAYIAATLEENGYSPDVFDLNVEPKLKIPWSRYDIVGITTVTSSIKAAWQLCREAKCANPQILTVLGGHHVNALPEESVSLPDVDGVIRGEGEYAMLELCETIERGKSFKDILGLTYKVNGAVKSNEPRPLNRELDKLPLPAYHLFPLSKYESPERGGAQSGSMITSRGCPFSCTFCSIRNLHGRAFRPLSVNRVIENMHLLQERFKVDHIGINDDLLNANMKRLFQICSRIKEERFDFTWDTPNGIRVDLVSEEMFRTMKSVGCTRVCFGVESGSQYVLDNIIKKRIKLEQVRRAVRLAKKSGMEVHLFFVLGLPGETPNHMIETINLAMELNPDYAQFSIACPYPGTELYWQVKDKLLSDDWDYFGHWEGKAMFKGQEVAEPYFKLAYRRFYLMPRYMLRMALRRNSYKHFKKKIGTLIHFLKG